MTEINKHAILVTVKATGHKLLYSSLKKFTECNPDYSLNTLYNYTSRKQKQFEDEFLTLEKIPFAS